MVSFIAFVPCLLLVTVGIPGVTSGFIGGFGMGMPMPMIHPIPMIRPFPMIRPVPVPVPMAQPMMMRNSRMRSGGYSNSYRKSKSVLGVKTTRPESKTFIARRGGNKGSTNLYDNRNYMLGGLGPDVNRNININVNNNGYGDGYDNGFAILPRQRQQNVVYMDNPGLVYSSQDDEDKNKVALLNSGVLNGAAYPGLVSLDDIGVSRGLGGSFVNAPLIGHDNGFGNDNVVVINDPFTTDVIGGGGSLIGGNGGNTIISTGAQIGGGAMGNTMGGGGGEIVGTSTGGGSTTIFGMKEQAQGSSRGGFKDFSSKMMGGMPRTRKSPKFFR